MYQVTKKISFCYAHRLLDYEGPCANLHGHNGELELILEAPGLDQRGMVYEFGELKARMSGWIDEHLDHKTLLRGDDILVETLQESGQAVYVMKQNPTAEAIAEMIFYEGRKLGLPVVEVRLWETPNSSASYRKES